MSLTRSKRIAASILLFILSYPVFLVIWIQVKPFYGALLVRATSEITALVKNAQIKEIKNEKEKTTVSFVLKAYTLKGWKRLEVNVSFFVSTYTFNVPLTLALILGLFPMVSFEKKKILEAGAILILVHMVFVFSMEGRQIYYASVKSGIQPRSEFAHFFWDFLWSFSVYMLIRFEPFLIAIYLYLRSPRSGFKLLSR